MSVGFMGTGLMGLPMAQRILDANESDANLALIAYTRTASKLAPLQEAGAAIAATPAEVIQTADCIILMLTNAQAIQEMVLTEETIPLLSGRTIIQMSTIAPSESRAIADQVTAAGGEYLEAPVLGSIPEAKAGKLMIMVGSSPAQFTQWSGLLKNFGPEPVLIGPVGSASALKLALNQLIASLTTAFATSLGFVLRQGVEVETFMQILRQSALYAPTFDKKLQRMCDRNYANPNFPTKHLLKDTDLFIAEAESVGLNIDGVAGVRQ
ncbi:MAG: NAD(P)-dependent oxidoreductase, partial [Leptolyngbyaceae bacterium]|nr:NAD(P)-dependent oxidoreductase [Leptolyngbyaceae bacterium]